MSSIAFNMSKLAAFSLLILGSAHAAVQSFTGTSYTISTSGTTTRYFAAEYGGSSTSFLGPTTNGIRFQAESVGVWVSPQQSVMIASDTENYENFTTNFAYGSAIDLTDFVESGSNYLSYSNYPEAEFAVGTQGYVGYNFISGLNMYFGWMSVTRTSDGATIDAWAFESTPNTPILAGYLTSAAVPEPATAAACAGLAAVAFAVSRRRRVR